MQRSSLGFERKGNRLFEGHGPPLLPGFGEILPVHACLEAGDLNIVLGLLDGRHGDPDAFPQSLGCAVEPCSPQAVLAGLCDAWRTTSS